MERRLAAIVAADVVGYSRLIEQDEESTLAALRERRRHILNPLVAQHHGRIVKVMGDGALIEFASAVNAVACAVELQKQMAAANIGVADDRHIVLRVGVNLGDVVVEGGDLYGDGVVVASRLEALAGPGDVWIAANVRDQIDKKLAVNLQDLGPRELKNMAQPVHVYRIDIGAPSAKIKSGAGVLSKPSIAVLPFVNMSGDQEQQYFSDGITEDIITELSRFRSFLVISRPSSFTYQGRAVSVQAVGQELGVRYVVEGSVRKVGSRVRVTVQLIDAESGNHLWAERYDRDFADIFSVQDEVTQNIVASLAGRVDEAGGERALRNSAHNLSQYDLLLQGKYFLNRGSKDDIRRARELFQKVLERDASNSPAYVGLAWTYLRESGSDWAGASASRAFDHARMAVDLDDHNSQAHLILAWAYLRTRSNFDLAGSQVDKAITLNPNDCDNYCFKSWLLTVSGDPDGGIVCANEALRRNPLVTDDCLYTIGVADYLAGRHEKALSVFGKMSPSRHPDVCACMAACYAQLGRDEDARIQAEEFLRRARSEFPEYPARDVESWRAYWARNMPFKDAAQFDSFLANLCKAGFPD
jgi:adenylate cyclase